MIQGFKLFYQFVVACGLVLLAAPLHAGKSGRDPNAAPMRRELNQPSREQSQELRLVTSSLPHEVVLLNSGIGSLYQRLLIIEAAKKSIDIEYFIFREDISSRILINALLRKAKEGVRVRILVDGTPVIWTLKGYHAKVLKSLGIELKFYNPTPMIAQFTKSQHRNHRKLMVVDNLTAILGGRNIADEYFDLKQTYNFLDRDLLVRGPIVEKIQKGFEVFWNYQYSEIATAEPPTPQEFGFATEREASMTSKGAHMLAEYRSAKRAYQEGMNGAYRMVRLSQDDLQVLEQVIRVGAFELAREYKAVCENNVFFGDLPSLKSKARVAHNYLLGLFSQAKKSLVIESPYFIISPNEPFFDRPLRSQVDVRILTNSIYSTDAIPSAAVFTNRIYDLLHKGARTWVYEGQAPQWTEFVDGGGEFARWGVHAKTAVVDHKDSVIMTYNIDPRSQSWNSEMGYACLDNPGLANAIQSDIDRAIGQSVELNKDGAPRDGRSRYFKTSINKVILSLILNPFSELFSFLL